MTKAAHPGSGCSGPVHGLSKLDHAFQQSLDSASMGVFNVPTELDEGIHFLVSRFVGSEKLRSFEGCSGTRSKLKQQSPSKLARVFDEKLPIVAMQSLTQLSP